MHHHSFQTFIKGLPWTCLILVRSEKEQKPCSQPSLHAACSSISPYPKKVKFSLHPRMYCLFTRVWVPWRQEFLLVFFHFCITRYLQGAWHMVRCSVNSLFCQRCYDKMTKRENTKSKWFVPHSSPSTSMIFMCVYVWSSSSHWASVSPYTDQK